MSYTASVRAYAEMVEVLNKQKRKAEKVSSVLSELLGKSTSGVPILSGRKTATMKQLEEKKKAKKELTKRKLENRRKIETKIPSTTNLNIDFERQLRKLATKGVVALFNAVSKAKRDGSKATAHLKNSSNNNNGMALPSSSSSVVSLEERSVGSDVSSITANNSIIHRSRAVVSSSSALSRKRPAFTGSDLPTKHPRTQPSEGWDKDLNDEDL